MNTSIEPIVYDGSKSEPYVTGWNDCVAALRITKQPSATTLHQHLLDLLGAKDHADAARIIAGHHLRKIAEPSAPEPVVWMLRDTETGELYWDDVCVFLDASSANEFADQLASDGVDERSLECFPLYATPPAPRESTATAIDVDALAQQIRVIDGPHSMSAAALAERIVEWLSAPPAPRESSDRAAYEGAREDLLDWKGRAQRAEARLRALGYQGIDASEPPATCESDQFSAALASAREHAPTGQGGESNDYIRGWRDVLEYIAMRYSGDLPATAPREPSCWCRTCRPVTPTDSRFVVCPDCGNKRCPRANDHRHACTRSNVPGQPGSAYPETTAPREAAQEPVSGVVLRDGRPTLLSDRNIRPADARLYTHPTPQRRESELEALRKFKAYVHERLDAACVPVDPQSPHRDAGCRIGGRLDVVLAAYATPLRPVTDEDVAAALAAIENPPFEDIPEEYVRIMLESFRSRLAGEGA